MGGLLRACFLQPAQSSSIISDRAQLLIYCCATQGRFMMGFPYLRRNKMFKLAFLSIAFLGGCTIKESSRACFVKSVEQRYFGKLRGMIFQSQIHNKMLDFPKISTFFLEEQMETLSIKYKNLTPSIRDSASQFTSLQLTTSKIWATIKQADLNWCLRLHKITSFFTDWYRPGSKVRNGY